MKRLPPLTAVEAFVQAARLGSVKAAAEALALSSPALTRRIQALERHIGRPLFERRHQAVHLNPDGERLLAEIGPVLDELGDAMERAHGNADLMRLRLGVLPLFASHRLMPQLGELRALHPDLHIDLDTRPQALARLDEGLDAAIILGRDVDPALYSRRLVSNRVIAVGGGDTRAMTDPRQLADATVLIHRDLPEAYRRMVRGGRRARPRSGGDRHVRFGAIHPRRRRPGARHRLHVRDAPRRARTIHASRACSASRPRALMSIGSPAAARRSAAGRCGSSTTG